MDYWDDSTRFDDDSKCIACGGDMGKSLKLVCSATCEDLLDLRSEGNDCYA